ncbi:hypothetical protein HDU83_007722 [Entophlyctis luteolus]|nr:hypothetical protein HDU83_007722 [Entophlyctis luteolus]
MFVKFDADVVEVDFDPDNDTLESLKRKIREAFDLDYSLDFKLTRQHPVLPKTLSYLSLSALRKACNQDPDGDFVIELRESRRIIHHGGKLHAFVALIVASDFCVAPIAEIAPITGSILASPRPFDIFASRQPIDMLASPQSIDSDKGSMSFHGITAFNPILNPKRLSHRQSSESAMAKVLSLSLNQGGVHSFLDRHCIPVGEAWEESFLQGLLHADVIVVLCSTESLQRIFAADEYPDNMLLELELALDQLATEKSKILIVFVGETVKVDGVNCFQEFKIPNFQQFPNAFHKHNRSPKQRTIAETMRNIFSLQAVFGWESKVEDENLKFLRLLLKPVEMEQERSRLRDAHKHGTREWLLNDVLSWVSDTNSSRVMWLQGGPGVGKSVIAGLVADRLQSKLLLGLAFFCKHDDDERRDAQKLLFTLIYGLARWNPFIAQYLFDLIKKEESVLTLPIGDQFQKLVIDPLLSVESPKTTVVLVIDALDGSLNSPLFDSSLHFHFKECGLINQRDEILEIIAGHCANLPPFVKLFVTSRSEEDIVAAFANLHPYSELRPTEENNIADIRLFARELVRKIEFEANEREENYNEAYKDSIVEKIVMKSGGVFIFMDVVKQHILHASTIAELSDAIEKLPSGLDAAYMRTIEWPYQDEPILKDVMDIIIAAREPLSIAAIAALMNRPLPIIQKPLERIQGVLKPFINGTGVQILHKSFGETLVIDFLINEYRCTNPAMLCDVISANRSLANHCLFLMNRMLRQNMCSLRLSELHSEVVDFATRIRQHIPEYLQYACEFWITHLVAIPTDLVDHVDLKEQLGEFMLAHLLHWLEALSLVGKLGTASRSLPKLSRWLSLSKVDPQWQRLASDAAYLIQEFHTPISVSAVHIYTSALPFCPRETDVYRVYATNILPKVICGTDAGWSPCLRTLEGHRAVVYSVALTQDGLQIVTASEDMSVRIWETETGRLLQVLRGHTGVAHSVGVTPDGRRIVTGSADGTAKAWVARGGRLLRTFDVHRSVVYAVAIVADGSAIVTGSADKIARIWNVETGDIIQSFEGHVGWVRSVAILMKSATTPGVSNTGIVVTGSSDKSARIWDAKTGELIHKLEGHRGTVYSVAITNDGANIATGSADRTAKLWDAGTGKLLRTFVGHKGTVYSVSVAASKVVTASDDFLCTIWDLQTATPLQKLEGHSHFVRSVVVSRDGSRVVTASSDTTAKVWDTQIRAQSLRDGHQGTVYTICRTPDGTRVVTGSSDKTAKLWDCKTGQLLRTFEGHTEWVRAVAITPNGKFVVTGSDDWTAKVWYAEDGRLLDTIKGHTGVVCEVAVSPDCQWVVTKSHDGTANVWEYPDAGKELPGVELSSDSSSCFQTLVETYNARAFANPIIREEDGWLLGHDGSRRVWIPLFLRWGEHGSGIEVAGGVAALFNIRGFVTFLYGWDSK